MSHVTDVLGLVALLQLLAHGQSRALEYANGVAWSRVGKSGFPGMGICEVK